MIKKTKYNMFIIPLLLAFRMLGLFMLLPVFSIFSNDYMYSNYILTGIALGMYGFSQSIFIIPFGYLSDKYGRKKLITIGFILFAFGSFIGYVSSSIYGIILARFLQGSAAISSVLLALASDLSSEDDRTKNMALIGISIGASFLLAIILGPFISYNFGMDKIFLFSFYSSLLGIYILNNFLSYKESINKSVSLEKKSKYLFSKSLFTLYLCVFIIHANLTTIFLWLPKLLIQTNDFFFQSIKFYLPVLLISLLLLLPILIFLGNKIEKIYVIFFGMFLLLISNVYILLFNSSYIYIFIGMVVFFISFNLLESLLPSLIAKISNKNTKGTTLGIFSCFQFMGIFFGGSFGGIINYMFSFCTVMYFCISIIIVWFIINIMNIKKINL